MKTLQAQFELAVPAEKVGDRTDSAGTQGVEYDWVVDPSQFPQILQFLIDVEPGPCNAHAVSGSRGEIRHFDLDTYDMRMHDFGGALIEASTGLPNDAAICVNFEDPPATVELRYPGMVWRPSDRTELDPNPGRMVINFDATNPPAWLATEVPAAV